MPAVMEAPATPRARKSIMWTRDDCRKLEAAGVLPDRWELVQGDIVSKMGINLPHAAAQAKLNKWLQRVFSGDRTLGACSIDVSPVDNPTSQPEPDIIVLNRDMDQLKRNPGPGDITLLVEISDTSLDHDLGAKASLYARAGIPEYWVLDVNGRCLHRHLDPQAGGYASVVVIEPGQVVTPLGQPDATLDPGSLLAE